MNEMVMFGRTKILNKVSSLLVPVVVFRSALFNFPNEGRLMRHPSTMGSGVSDFNNLIEKMLEKKGESFTLSVYRATQSDLYTQGSTFIIPLKEGVHGESLIKAIKSQIGVHFKEVDYIDCEEDASALLVGIC